MQNTSRNSDSSFFGLIVIGIWIQLDHNKDPDTWPRVWNSKFSYGNSKSEGVVVCHQNPKIKLIKF